MEKDQIEKSKHHIDPHSKREEGVCSNLCYNNFYQLPFKQHHKPRSFPYSTKPKVDLPSFNGIKNVETYLEWKTMVH